MTEFLQIALDGFMTGTVYAALALALSVVFQGTGMLNLAQGELAVVAATTGPTNIVAQALTPDPAALHGYLTGPLAALPGVHTVESAPVLLTLKGAGPRAGEV